MTCLLTRPPIPTASCNTTVDMETKRSEINYNQQMQGLKSLRLGRETEDDVDHTGISRVGKS